MGRVISLFADYHGKENSVTNYCGLILSLVYGESPKLFALLLDLLFNSEVRIPIIGPVFEQQSKRRNSIPDLTISQESFQILFETKVTDWYGKEQLENHVGGFSEYTKTKILVLLCNFEDKNMNSERNAFKNEMKNKGVSVVEMTFEDLFNALRAVCLTPTLKGYLGEFEDYLNRNDLLPLWKNTLDVVNCASFYSDLEDYSVYICPDLGGQFRHKRAKYLGAYKNKIVKAVYTIDAVVVVEKGSKCSIKWKNNLSLKDEDIKKTAKDKVRSIRPSELNHNNIQVFLLSNKRITNFVKDSHGGLYGSKRYFLVESKDVDQLADELNNIKWSEFLLNQ